MTHVEQIKKLRAQLKQANAECDMWKERYIEYGRYLTHHEDLAKRLMNLTIECLEENKYVNVKWLLHQYMNLLPRVRRFTWL